MAMINQIQIQKFWFDEKLAEDVLAEYGLTQDGTPVSYKMAHTVLCRSKKRFLHGDAFIFRDDVDKRISEIACIRA